MYCNKAVKSDLQQVFKYFSTECLLHLKDNRHRLIRGVYKRGENGCMFFLLSEPLPEGKRIESREALARHFAGECRPSYQDGPARAAEALVNLVDGRVDEIPNNRYGDLDELDWDLVFGVLDEELGARGIRELEEVGASC